MGSANGNQMSLEHLGWLQLLNWGVHWEQWGREMGEWICALRWGKQGVHVLEFLFYCRLLISCVLSTARSMGSCAGQTRLGQSMTG